MEIIKELIYQSFVDYVINNSTLKKDQFTFAMQGGHGYATFIVAKDNKLLFLGEFSFDRFIRGVYGTDEDDLIAITKFLNLCIKKLEDHSIKVPILYGNPEVWDRCYKE